jgi:hypothetical protein
MSFSLIQNLEDAFPLFDEFESNNNLLHIVFPGPFLSFHGHIYSKMNILRIGCSPPPTRGDVCSLEFGFWDGSKEVLSTIDFVLGEGHIISDVEVVIITSAITREDVVELVYE